MSCAEARDLLAAHSLGALDADERAELEAHLARCPACVADQRPYQEIAARLALALPRCEPPRSLRRRILSAALAEPASHAPTGRLRVRSESTPPRLEFGENT